MTQALPTWDVARATRRGLCLLLVGAAACGPRAAPRTPAATSPPPSARPAAIAPGPGASFYGELAADRTGSAGAHGTPSAGAALRSAIVDDARHLARESGRGQPVGDVRLDRLAEDLGRLGVDVAPSYDLIDFLMSHHGIVDPQPHLVVASHHPGDDAATRERVAGEVRRVLGAGRVSRIGVGMVDRREGQLVVVALLETSLTLEPVPRRVPDGGQVRLLGRLDPGFAEPRVIVTGPQGAVEEVAVRGDGPRFDATVRCERGRGRYRVEVAATDASGSVVLANFWLWCGEEPPAMPAAAASNARTVDARAGERLIWKLVNDERAAAGLVALAWDEGLADVARAHSRDMAGADFVGHISPRTGDALARARRAGLSPALLAENVVRAASAEEAQRSLMLSPGHRDNVLQPKLRKVGVGIVAVGEGNGLSLYVTQLFSD